jgi:hypothetical protein
MAFKIITCAQWGAEPPARPIRTVGRPSRILFHHTEGLAPRVDGAPGESREEAIAYARMLQRDHIHRRGFIDSGHNFLVARSGHILEGRHGSLAAVKAGRMVESAHCPGQNDQPGIEHEHVAGQDLTPAQKAASVWLHAFICRRTGIRPTEIFPHRKYYATDCPTPGLVDWLPALRLDVAQALTREPKHSKASFGAWARWYFGRGEFAGRGRRNPLVRPAVPQPVPGAWWARLDRWADARGLG